MDPIRVAPSSSTHGSRAERQKTGSENAQQPGAFFALLAGLGAQALASDEEAPLSVGTLAGDSGTSDSAGAPFGLFFDGSPYALTTKEAGDALGEVPDSASLQGIVSDAAWIGAASGAGPHGTDARNQGAVASTPGGRSTLVTRMDAMLAPENRLVAGSLANAGLVAQTARMDAVNAAPTDGVVGVQVPSPASARRIPNLALSAKTQPLAQAINAAGKPASLAQVAGVGVLNTLKEMQAVLANPSSHAELHTPAEAGRSSTSDTSGLTGLPPLPTSAGAWAGDLPGGRSQQSANDRAGSGSTAIGQAWGESAASPTMEVGAGTADAGAPSPEEAMAEQVTYWLSENLKNAELTVEHAGQPVEVRVSLAGNEAHVAFRSDQAEVRELLSARLEQLRELLQGQGLQLSGATVDTGTSGQSGEPSGKSAPEGAQTAGVRPATEVLPQAPRRTLTSSSVDLYV